MTTLHGDFQGCFAAKSKKTIRLDAQVGSFAEQQQNHVLVAVPCGKVQGCPSLDIFGVHLCPTVQQELHHILVPVLRCFIECSLYEGVQRVRLSTPVKRCLHMANMPISGSAKELYVQGFLRTLQKGESNCVGWADAWLRALQSAMQASDIQK